MGAMAQLNGDSGPFIRNTFFLYLSTILTIFCQFLIIYTLFVYQFGQLTSTIYHFRPFMTILGHLLAVLDHFLPIFCYLQLYLAVCIGLYRRLIIFLTNSGPFRVRAQLEQARALLRLQLGSNLALVDLQLVSGWALVGSSWALVGLDYFKIDQCAKVSAFRSKLYSLGYMNPLLQLGSSWALVELQLGSSWALVGLQLGSNLALVGL